MSTICAFRSRCTTEGCRYAWQKEQGEGGGGDSTRLVRINTRPRVAGHLARVSSLCQRRTNKLGVVQRYYMHRYNLHRQVETAPSPPLLPPHHGVGDIERQLQHLQR